MRKSFFFLSPKYTATGNSWVRKQAKKAHVVYEPSNMPDVLYAAQKPASPAFTVDLRKSLRW